MKLVFIDETGDQKFKQYLGFCIAVMDSKSYPLLKTRAQSILDEVAWRRDTEFKGAYLFSQTRGCTEVEIERRIKAAGKLLDLNAKKHSRMKFSYGRMHSTTHTADYLQAVPELLAHALPRAPKGAGKNLISVVYDERADLPFAKFHAAVRDTVKEKGYVLFEHAIEGKSSFDAVGLMFADLVCYLAARIDVIANDAELFEGLTPGRYSENGKIRKLESSSDLIAKIRSLDLYRRK